MKKPIERVEVIMERLGFRDKSSEGTKAAFVKNLIKQAYGIDVALPQKYVEPSLDDFLQVPLRMHDNSGITATVFANNAPKAEPLQLSFDLDSLEGSKVS